MMPDKKKLIEACSKFLPEICLGAFLLGLGPLLTIQTFQLWERPHLQFFPLAWLAVLGLIWKRAKLEWTSSLVRKRSAATVGIIALSAAVLGAFFVSPWLGQFAGIMAITAWGLVRLAETPTSRWLAWTSLLWITLPLPFGYDDSLVQRLQESSSQSASAILDLLGTPHLRLGNLIHVRLKRLFVDEACSGVDSLYALLAICLFICVWSKQSLLVSLATIAATPLFTWLGNVFRLTFIAWSLDTFGRDFSYGWKHTVLGLVVFALMSASLYMFGEAVTALARRFPSGVIPRQSPGWYLLFNRLATWPDKPVAVKFSHEDYFGKTSVTTKNPEAPPPPTTTQSVDTPQMHLTILYSCVAFALLMMTVSSFFIARNAHIQSIISTPHFEEQQITAINEKYPLPLRAAGAEFRQYYLEQRSANSMFGQYSAVWVYQLGPHLCSVSLDFPFRGFHPLWECYQRSGQTLMGTPGVRKLPIPDQQEPWAIAEAQFEDEFGSSSYLWFCLFDGGQKPFEENTYRYNVDSRAYTRFDGRTYEEMTPQSVSYQLQLYVVTEDQLNREETDNIRALLSELAPFILKQARELSSQ